MEVATLVAALLVPAVAIGVLAWHFSRSDDVVQKWAQENGFRLIEQKYAHLKGPFFWTASKGQSVYRVTIEDGDGRRRSGWVLCGSWWGGLMSDQAQVRWDDELHSS